MATHFPMLMLRLLVQSCGSAESGCAGEMQFFATALPMVELTGIIDNVLRMLEELVR